MKIVALVPIKLNNERLPGKNIKAFDNGKPLCQYILDTLLTIEEIDEIYVYCSDESIIKYLPKGVKYLKRNKKFDSSNINVNDMFVSFAYNVPADIYILAHVTAPFLKNQSIISGIEALTHRGYDSAFTATILKDFIWKDDKPFNYDLNNIPRTQDLEKILVETTGMYMYKSDVILNHNRRIGFNPYFIEVSKIEAIDINEPVDFEIANAVYNFILKKRTLF